MADDPPGCTEDDARAAALALPETTERPCYGTPGFYVRGKLFARVWDGEDGVLVVRVADLETKELLLSAQPPICFTTPHYDGHPHVLLRLAAVGREELTELLEDAWRTRAPKRVLAAFDAPTPARPPG
jgi:hypothetical protein